MSIQSWEILDSGTTVLWGPSGSGKSTLIRGLLGLDDQAQVRWIFDGDDIARVPTPERRLGVVFQDPSLFPHMTARQNILFPVSHLKADQWTQDFEALVDGFDLHGFLEQKPSSLSGGEKQRVALARALIYRPRLLILDEPFSSLDGELRDLVRQQVQKMLDRWQCPLLLVTHDSEDVAALGEKVSLLNKGKIVQEMAAEAFLSQF